MTYLIEGTLYVRENPKNYLNENTSLETAISMCQTREVKISKTKFLTPKDWENYLNKTFAENNLEQTVSGKLNVWYQLRLPSPVLFIVSLDELSDVYLFEDGKFKSDENTKHIGCQAHYGLALDIPPLSVMSLKSRRTMASYTKF